MTKSPIAHGLVPRIIMAFREVGGLPQGEERLINLVQLQAWFDRLAEDDPRAADQLYAEAFVSADKAVRAGLHLFLDYYLALWPRCSPVSHAADDAAHAEPLKTVTFAVFGEALMLSEYALRGFTDVDALAFWVAQHLMVPLSAVRVCGLPLVPEECLEGAVMLRSIVDAARRYDRLALKEFTLTEEQRAQPKTLTSLVFLVTITPENPEQFQRLGAAISTRAGLGQPNKQRLKLRFGSDWVEFLPHDIGRIFSSLSRHMYYRTRRDIRQAVSALESHGYTVEKMGARFRTIVALDERPAAILTELFHLDTKEVLQLFIGPMASDEQYYLPRAIHTLQRIGVKTIKVPKPQPPEAKTRKKKQKRKQNKAKPAATAKIVRKLP